MSDFYGQEFLYPGIIAPDKVQTIRTAFNVTLWPLVVDLCRMSRVDDKAGGLFVAAVGSDAVMLTDVRGVPILQVKQGWTENNKGATVPEYEIKNWHHSLKHRGRDRSTIKSTNRTYIVKHMSDQLELVMESGKQNSNYNLNAAIKLLFEHLDNDTNYATSISNVSVPPDAYHSLLCAMFDPTFKLTDIPNDHAAKLKQDFDRLTEKFANKKTYADRAKDFYSGDKWLISHYAYNGMGTGVAITSLYAKVEDSRLVEAQTRTPRRLYRDLEHFYETNPDDAESLRSALTFSKVYRAKLPETHHKCLDVAGLLPVTSAVYEDIGTLTHNQRSGDAPSVPVNYLLPK